MLLGFLTEQEPTDLKYYKSDNTIIIKMKKKKGILFQFTWGILAQPYKVNVRTCLLLPRNQECHLLEYRGKKKKKD